MTPTALVRATMQKEGSSRAARPAAHLAEALLEAEQRDRAVAEGPWQDGVLQCHAGDAGRLHVFYSAHGVQCVAVPMVGIDQHRQPLYRAADAAALLGEFRQCDGDQVRRAEDGE